MNREKLLKIIKEEIKKAKGGYYVTSKSGRRLSKKPHKTRKAALAQLGAVEASKARSTKREKVNEGEPEERVASIKLPKGKEVVLKADTDEHKRGLVVKWRDDGGYDIYYWYGSPDEAVPAELKADGEIVGNDIKRVFLGYHPEIDKT